MLYLVQKCKNKNNFNIITCDLIVENDIEYLKITNQSEIKRYHFDNFRKKPRIQNNKINRNKFYSSFLSDEQFDFYLKNNFVLLENNKNNKYFISIDRAINYIYQLKRKEHEEYLKEASYVDFAFSELKSNPDLSKEKIKEYKKVIDNFIKGV